MPLDGQAIAMPIRPKKPMASNLAVPSGNTVVNTTAETLFASTLSIPGSDSTAIDRAELLQAGDVQEIRMKGNFDVNVAVPTLQGKVYLGPSLPTIGTTVPLLDTGAKGGLTAGTNLYWEAGFSLLFRAVGAAGIVEAQGLLFFQTAATAVIAVAALNLTGFTIDTRTDMVLSASADWSIASNSNRIQLRQFYSK